MFRSVADYPIAGYHQGIHNPGKFHLITFAQSEQEGHRRDVPHRHDFFELNPEGSSRGSPLNFSP